MNDVLTPICPYCREFSTKVTGAEIYSHRPDLHHLIIYECQDCDARVGCHKGTDRPMGRLANAELRQAKQKAHRAFDPLWKDGILPSRYHAYRWLADALNITFKECHIGMFDVETCQRTEALCKARIQRSLDSRP